MVFIQKGREELPTLIESLICVRRCARNFHNPFICLVNWAFKFKFYSKKI